MAFNFYERQYRKLCKLRKRQYGSNCVVVLDGYANNELNIKNSERQRWKNMYTSTNIIFEESMDVLTTQENVYLTPRIK